MSTSDSVDEVVRAAPTEADGKARVSIEPIPAGEVRPLQSVIVVIRERQQALGHVAPSREQIDRFLLDEQAS